MKKSTTDGHIHLVKRAAALGVAWIYLLTLSPALYAGGPENSTPPLPVAAAYAPEEGETSSAVISAETGGEVRLGRARIVIPAGALARDTEISITRLGTVNDTGESIENATERGGGYRFLPAGQRFRKEVRITLPYDRSLNLGGGMLDGMATYFYDTESKKWTKLKRLELDRPESTLTSATTHFTDMINATLTLPEAAPPLELSLNSIKGLEAADPLSGMMRMGAPQADSTGDASFSIQLQIPQGRRGMQPDVAIAYSSGGGSGILGKGFSLCAGSEIATDTRHGIPEYDGHDTYLKDGTELALASEANGEQEYTALREAAFEKITRHSTGGDDWWEVTAKDGTRRLYGMTGAGEYDGTGRAGYTGGGVTRTYVWNITEERDVYGNSVSYSYVKDGNRPYLSEIRYTGMNGSGGAYLVRLTYESRSDVRLDGRGRFPMYTAKRLAAIEALSGGTVLRRYEFSYTSGISGASLLSALTVRNSENQSYTYTFGYKGLGKDGQGNDIYFADPVQWEDPRPLQSGTSESSGGGVNASAGTGVGTSAADVRVTGGVTASFSSGTGHTEMTLADMDGDGRPDAVSQDGGTLYVWRNTGAGFAESPVTVSLPVSSELDREETGSTATGWNVYGGAGLNIPYVSPSAGVSYAETYQRSTGSVTSSLMDVDGDGLADVLISGRTAYLRNLGADGNGVRFAETALTMTGTVADTYEPLTADELASYKESFYEQTPFRAWRAPYAGNIYIEEAARRTATQAHEGSLYARTYIGNSSSDTAALRLDLSTAGTKSASATVAVSAGEYIWFIMDTGGEPLGTDADWSAAIRYGSVRAFSPPLPLPLAVHAADESVPATDAELISSLRFIPGRLTAAQMARLRTWAEARIPAYAAATDGEEDGLWAILASLYRYDGGTGMFLLHSPSTTAAAQEAYTAFFDGAPDSEIAAIKRLSLGNYARHGVSPSWDSGTPVYSADAPCATMTESALGYVGGKLITVSGGTVYEDGEASASYTLSSSTADGVILAAADGTHTITYTGTGGHISYGTAGAWTASANATVPIPAYNADGSISFTQTSIGAWSSATDFSTFDRNAGWTLHGDTDIAAESPLYGGVSDWHYGIWAGGLSQNPFSGAAITGRTENPMTEEEAETLRDRLSPGANGYSLTALRAQASSEKMRWYRPEASGSAVCGTETQGEKPYLTAGAVHSDRAGGNAYYSATGAGASPAGATVPSIRLTLSRGTDRTTGGNAGTGIAGLGTNGGRNESTGTVLQTMQDMNGDGIPDIVQSSGGSVTYVPLVRERHGWGVTVNAASEAALQGAGSISVSETDVSVSGASISAGGAVTVLRRTTGKGVEVRVNASPSAGAGSTETSGTTEGSSGLTDLNGDGLPDWYSGGTVRTGLGDRLDEAAGLFPGLSALSVSRSESRSVNVNLGIGTTTSTNASSLSSGVNGGVGASRSTSTSRTTMMLLDLNGDGLADIVTKDGEGTEVKVRWNLGTSFADEQTVALPSWGVSDDSVRTAPDITGLPFDVSAILSSPSGAGRYDGSLDWTESETVSVSGNIGANVNVPVPVWLLTLNITTNAGGSIDASATATTTEARMLDMDGDGLADHVLRIAGRGMWVKRNLTGTADNLVKVGYPWGGSVTIGYSLIAGTTDEPHAKYAMTGLTADDGCAESAYPVAHGSHAIHAAFEYEGGRYDRLRRESYGYGTVRTIYDDGSYIQAEYFNDAYYSKGIASGSRSYGKRTAQGTVELLTETKTTLRDAPYAQPAREEIYQYGSTGGVSVMRSEYTYGSYGNVTRVSEVPLRNGTADATMTLTADIAWDDTRMPYLHSLPVSIAVYGNGNSLLRKRTGSYDDYGALISLSQYHTASDAATYTLSYDTWGNLATLTDGLGVTLSYTYDTSLHQYPVQTARSGGGITYTSTAAWNAVTGTKTGETDINGNSMSYLYDAWQRPTEIRTSYDTGTTPAVSYSYGMDGAGRWYAITNNKVSFTASDTSVIQTVIQADGLGRTSRTAKTGVVYDGNSGTKKNGWNISGAVSYDAKGRVVSQGQPYFIEGNLSALSLATGAVTATMTRPTLTEYDGLDRAIKTTLPDGSIQTTEYDVTASGAPYTRTTDPLGNAGIRRTDPAGNIVSVERLDSEGTSLTSAAYTYDAIGDMLSATDVQGHGITATYDLLGRRLTLTSADGGRTEWGYDAYNLVSESTAAMREKALPATRYCYDGQNRLVRIDYPETTDTVYTYGEPCAANNAAGKITLLTDAGGTTGYKYGKLGETVEETRTIQKRRPGGTGSLTATTGYVSNYLGQTERITYPDGELVEYGYDAGGQVVSVTGTHYGHTFLYVTDIGYDEHGQRVYMDYGTGVRTEYEYDANRRWLSSIGTAKGTAKYQNISYSFDPVGNVLGYTNDCTTDGVGYTTSQSYTYDALYQLTGASGSTTYAPYVGVSPEHTSTYNQSFTFDVLGNMTQKTSAMTVEPSQLKLGDDLDYSLTYAYAEGFAHRLDHIGDRYYRYDASGNIILEGGQDAGTGGGNDDDDDDWEWDDEDEGGGIGGGSLGGGGSGSGSGGQGSGADATVYRSYEWNERNRMVRSTSGGTEAQYVYGEDGQRSNKWTSSCETVYFSRMWVWRGDASFTAQNAKNIYLGNDRLVTKINSEDGHDSYSEELHKTYYYHTDHLGSAQLITDWQGSEYQRIEYTPYGETWVEKTNNTYDFLPYKFTGKELDEETGLYYYGARYMDPKFSIWTSADPALGDYLPVAPTSDDARKRNQNLPGMGGVFNTTNRHLYNYAGNNPVRYIDPDGEELVIKGNKEYKQRVSEYLRQLAPGASVDMETGKVSFDKTVSPGRFIKGSELVETLVNNGVTIIKDKNIFNTSNNTIPKKDGSICITFFYDFTMDIPTVMSDQNGKRMVTERYNPMMVLGHELIHALHYIEGTCDVSPVDFYVNLFGVAGALKDIAKEELRTVGMPDYYTSDDITENMLRGEHLFLLRADYE